MQIPMIVKKNNTKNSPHLHKQMRAFLYMVFQIFFSSIHFSHTSG